MYRLRSRFIRYNPLHAFTRTTLVSLLPPACWSGRIIIILTYPSTSSTLSALSAPDGKTFFFLKKNVGTHHGCNWRKQTWLSIADDIVDGVKLQHSICDVKNTALCLPYAELNSLNAVWYLTSCDQKKMWMHSSLKLPTGRHFLHLLTWLDKRQRNACTVQFSWTWMRWLRSKHGTNRNQILAVKHFEK